MQGFEDAIGAILILIGGFIMGFNLAGGNGR